MSNVKLIKALRCKTSNVNDCTMCAYHNACYDGTLQNIAADALEAAEKRIAELEAQLPWVESVMEDKLRQRIDDLENDKTILEAEIINLEIALDKAHCELEARLPKDEQKRNEEILFGGIENV